MPPATTTEDASSPTSSKNATMHRYALTHAHFRRAYTDSFIYRDNLQNLSVRIHLGGVLASGQLRLVCWRFERGSLYYSTYPFIDLAPSRLPYSLYF